MIRSDGRSLSIVAAVVGAAMAGSGLSKLASESHQVATFALWGLPAWFLALVGTFEVIGALLLIVRATRPVGSLILGTIMVGALWGHVAHAEWSHAVPPALLLTIFLTIFWRSRLSAVRLLTRMAVPAPALRATQTRDAPVTMRGSWRAVVWFDRFVLAAATLVMLAIAFRNLRDPVAATLPLGILLSSPTAVTIARVGLGGFPLGIALVLFGCLIAKDRLLSGLTVLVAVVGAVTGARIEGLLLDGATAYNLQLLRPEFAMLTLGAIGIVLERRRRRGDRLRMAMAPDKVQPASVVRPNAA